MFERKVRLASEALARGMSRRTFLRRSGGAVVGGVTAFAMGSLLSMGGTQVDAGTLVPNQPSCAPPGPYCNTGSGALSGCRGAHCFQHASGGQVYACHVFYIYPVGCWTTAQGGGYWTCCDCTCDNGSSCGCAQYSTSPQTLPE